MPENMGYKKKFETSTLSEIENVMKNETEISVNEDLMVKSYKPDEEDVISFAGRRGSINNGLPR